MRQSESGFSVLANRTLYYERNDRFVCDFSSAMFRLYRDTRSG